MSVPWDGHINLNYKENCFRLQATGYFMDYEAEINLTLTGVGRGLFIRWPERIPVPRG